MNLHITKASKKTSNNQRLLKHDNSQPASKLSQLGFIANLTNLDTEWKII
jgi:hypothetical protein